MDLNNINKNNNNDYMISMNEQLIKHKYRSVWDFMKYVFYFHNFYVYHNIPFILTSICILYFIEGEFSNNLFTYVMAGFSSWFFHWFSHKCKFFNLISGHRLHHQNKTTIFEDAHEFLSDVFAAGLGLMLLNYAVKHMLPILPILGKKPLFNNYVLLLFMIAFPLVHLIIYHRILKQSYHQEHHEQTKTNFSPDYFDHIFGTNQDHRIEDISHMVPIFIVVGIIVILIQRYKIITF